MNFHDERGNLRRSASQALDCCKHESSSRLVGVALPLSGRGAHERVPASHARTSTNAGLDPRLPTHLLVAKLASHGDVRRDARAGRPPIRAQQGSRRRGGCVPQLL